MTSIVKNSASLKQKPISWYKENLKYFGIHTKSNNKTYLIKKYSEVEKKLIKSQAHVKGWLAQRQYNELKAQNHPLIYQLAF